MKHVLLVEDDRALRRSLAQSLELDNISVTQAASVTEAKDYITADFRGVVLSDIRMPGRDGFDLLAHVKATDPELPVVLLTGESDVPTAVRAINDGAYDYLEKPCAPDQLSEVLLRALDHRALVLKSRDLDTKLRRSDPAAINFPGASDATVKLRDDLRRAAALPVHLHLTGASGSGKKLAAHTVHSLSANRENFITLSLISAPDDIFRTVQVPNGPADFSIKNLDAATPFHQAEILRMIETHPDLRILTSSVTSLENLREQGLSEDLFFALSLLEIHLPSLFERRRDLPQIFEAVLRQAVRSLDLEMPALTDALYAEVMTRRWHDNLPELRNFARSIALGLNTPAAQSPHQTLADQMDAFEKMILADTLRRNAGRAAPAAETLGLPRKTFYDKLARHGLRPKDFKSET